jgi:hypothetical protein
MAGAYTAVAEGIDGATVNAASPAVREPFSYDWIDYDIDVDFSLPGAYGGTDFDNRGPQSDPKLQSTTNGFLYLHGGAQVQLGELGFSATAELFQYAINPVTGGTGVTLLYGRYHALGAYGLAGNQIIVGGGLRVITLQVKSQGSSLTEGQTLLTLNGVGPEAGVVIKPNGFPFRLGSTVRSAVGATVAGVVGEVGGFFGKGPSSASLPVTKTDGFILPERAAVPWELESGFAFQLGPRPLNPPWLNPRDMERHVRERIDEARAARAADYVRELESTPAEDRDEKKRGQAEHEDTVRAIEDQELDAESTRLRAIREARDANWPRERITVYGSLLITGISSGAISLEGFTTQTAEPVGRHVSLSPRVGIESEPIRNWLAARVGSYLEPSRFEQGTARQHFTFGGDIRLFPFSPWGIFGDQIWRVTVAADLAPRYQNFGIGIGAWH